MVVMASLLVILCGLAAVYPDRHRRDQCDNQTLGIAAQEPSFLQHISVPVTLNMVGLVDGWVCRERTRLNGTLSRAPHRHLHSSYWHSGIPVFPLSFWGCFGSGKGRLYCECEASCGTTAHV